MNRKFAYWFLLIMSSPFTMFCIPMLVIIFWPETVDASPILLQADVLPTNIWTVGGALALFAGVIAYLFKLYSASQEARFKEMKDSFESRLLGMQNDLNEEKAARRSLQAKFDDSITTQMTRNANTLEKVEVALIKVLSKLDP